MLWLAMGRWIAVKRGWQGNPGLAPSKTQAEAGLLMGMVRRANMGVS
jgi:hypothetical protein